MDEILDTFFSENELPRLFHYFCETSVGEIVDPITETITLMTTSPIELIVTETGVTLFKNRSTHVYPYSKMTAGQKEYVRKTILRVLSIQSSERESIRHNPSANFLSHDYDHCQNSDTPGRNLHPLGGKGHAQRQKPKLMNGVQMGGGFVIFSSTAAGVGDTVLPLEKVANVFCNFVFMSKIHQDPVVRKGICNIVIQRVCSSAFFPKSSIAAVANHVRDLYDAQTAQ